MKYSELLVETQLEIALRLAYFDEPRLKELLAQTQEVARMLNGLIRSLNPE